MSKVKISDSKIQAKRVDIVSVKLVKETSILYANRRINSPEDVAKLTKDFLDESDREKFIAVYLNTKHEPVAMHTVSVGTLSSTLVHPREIFKGAILSNSAAIVIVHNHPSGDATPSLEDVEVTRRLSEAGKLLGIELLDHLVVGNNSRYVSLKEQGII